MPANTSHHCFEQPYDNDIKIWRYMDFTKYASMLSTQSLFFSRVDLQDDPYEGAITKAGSLLRSIYLTRHGYSKKELENISKSEKLKRQRIYINCWHMNEHESAAMWKLYAQTNNAIAIQSTYHLLCEALPEGVYLGLIKYINYDSKDWYPPDNEFWKYVHKRKSFSHENEIRCLMQLPADPVTGRYPTNPPSVIPINISFTELIQKIYVSPSAPEWFLELTKSITKKYGFDFIVDQSSLALGPIF